jgi:TP901 family phage tail tape measure protein
MAEDANARIRVDIDTAEALANIKNLQRQISAFHTNMAKGGAAAAATSLNLQQGLLNSINRTGQFSATIKNVRSTTESFTNSLEKNKLSMREYFRYSGAATKTFGRFFATEFDTINKVARERVKDLQTQYIKMGRDANGAIKAIAVRPLALDMENLGTRTQIAAQRQALLNQMLKQGSTNLLNFGKNTQWAGRQLMVGFTIPLVMFGSVASKTFMDMEKQAIRFKRVYGEMFTTTAETTKALEEIKDLANEFTKYGVAVAKTMELAADIAATGKMGADLTAQVSEATRLAVLGGVEQAEALKATISLTDAFGVSAEQLAGKIDFLNAVENQTVTSIEDLTVAIPKAGPVVQQLGGDVQDLTFFLTAMREGGINASEGANALKSGLASMINPTGKAAEMLEGFGINLKGIVNANKGNVKGIVIDFAKALDTLDPLNRAQAIEQLFGKFQFARLSTLFQNVIKEGNQASRVLKLANATTEELAILSERELKKVEDSPMFKFQKAVEDIKVTLVPLGEAFLKAVTPVLEFGTKILEKFNELDAGAKQFVVGLTAIAGVIGPVFLMGFGLIANGVANVIKGFVFFKTAMNKAASSSTQLGLQTEYMTQQQLESQAVAASLNQIHTKLIQTFTSETSAINNLTTAYQRSVVAQGGIAGGAIGRTRPNVKANRGLLSVPGPKGAGDIIPAMLSPGEAIIPAKQAKKYRGFISSMISDNVPGFRFGFNPFASMLGRSKVAVRMRSDDFSSALSAEGKNARYKGAFATQTGADYINPSGSKTIRQRELRSAMERDVFGLDPKTAALSSRPTYGYAKTSIIQGLINKIFGIKGKNFNALTRNPGDSLDKYGNIDLITKGSVAKRSSAFPGDALVNYNWATQAGTRSNIPDLNRIIQNTGIRPAPMRGGSADQLKGFERLGSPFGSNKVPGTSSQYWTNPKSAYVETYTPGGFDFKEIDRIIANNPRIAKQLRSELKSVGLSSVRVSGPSFTKKLFKALRLPGYKDGIFSVPGPKGAGDIMPSMLSPGEAVIPAKPAKKYASLIQSMIADNIPGFRNSNVKDKSGMVVKDVKLGSSNSSVPASEKPAVVRRGSTTGKTFDEDLKDGYTRAYGKDAQKMIDYENNISKARETAIIEKSERSDSWKSNEPGKDNDIKNLTTQHRSHIAEVDKRISDAEKWRLGSVTRPDSNVSNNLVQTIGGTPKADGSLRNVDALKPYLENASSNKKQAKKIENLLRKGVMPAGSLSRPFAQALTSFSEDLESGKIKISDQTSKAGTVSPGMRHAGLAAADLTARENAIDEIEKTDPKAARLLRGSNEKAQKIANRISGLSNAGIRDKKEESKAKKENTAATKKETKSKKQNIALDTKAQKAKAEDVKVVKRNTNISKKAEATAKAKLKAGEDITNRVRKGYTAGLDSSGKAIFKGPDGKQVAANQALLARARKTPSAPVTGPQEAATQPKARTPGMGLGMAGMVATGAVMGGSMIPGEIGKISQDLMMPVMMLSMILPMLTNKFALVAAGIAGLVAAFVFVQMAIAGIRKESAEAVRSLSSGKEAMSKFAEAAGTVTGSEYMQKRRQQEVSPFVVETGKTTFGQSFIDSEAGTAMLSDFEKQVERFGQSRAIESLQKQLTTAVATGVLSAEQAQSIAQSLGQKLNDYGITANINASIQSIVGPDGKVLDGNTIKIYTEFIQSSTSGITGTGGILQSEDLTGGAPLWWWDTEKVAKREGEASGIIANFYDENQQIVDAFDAENLKNIDALFEQGKYDEALAAEEAYQIDRKNLIASYNTQIVELQKDFAGVDFTKQQGILSQLAGLAKKTDAKVGTAADKLSESKAVESSNILGFKRDRVVNRGQALSAEETAKINEFQQVKVQFLGEIAAGNIDSETFNGLMQMFDPTTSTGQATLSILAKISTEIGPQALAQLENIFAKLENPEQAAEIAVKIKDIKNPEQLQNTITTLEKLSTFDGRGIEAKVVLGFFGENPEKLAALQAKFTQLSDMAEAGKLNIQTLVDQRIITTGDMEAFKADQEYFNSLAPEQQVRYVQVYLSKIETIAENEIDAWFATNKDSKRTREQVAALLAGQAAKQYTIANPIKDPTVESKTVNSNSGGRKSDPLDGILKSLQNIRKASINAQGGMTELLKLFEKGKNISVFKGIENQLLKLTSNTDFSSFIAGLDKKEQDLFITVKNGNVELKQRGRLLEKAYRAKTVGDFVLSQQKLGVASKNELTARNLLIKAGYSYVEAVELSRDADIAAAYASAAATKGLKKRKKAIEDVDKALRKGLAAQKATLTAEEQFEDLYDKIQGKLDADKTAIELKFKLDSAADDKIIRDAENKIAEIQYKLDDQEAGLTLISDKEEVINEKYDKRLEALDKIKTVNDRISQQQKNQLSLADALSSGDIGAAAAAMQQIQQQFVSDSSAQQEDLIEKARQQELLNVTTLINGELKTREQIEKTIKDLQKEIFEIEEGRLEPALENNRILIAARDEALLKLDQESDKWLAVKNSIEIAKYAALDYAQALRDANALALQAIAQINNPLAATGQEPVVPQDVVPKDTSTSKSTGTPTPTPPPAPAELTQQQIIARDQAASKAAFEASGLSASGYVKMIEAQERAKTPKQSPQFTKAQIEAQERAAATAAANKKAAIASEARRDAALAARAPAPKVVSTGGYNLSARGNTFTKYKAAGGKVGYYPMGGLIPYMSVGGPFKAINTDTVPAMLTPGEFVVKRSAVEKFGVDSLKSINNGTYDQGSVYNYSVSVNVKTDADASQIAKTVMTQIKQIDSQRIRGVGLR